MSNETAQISVDRLEYLIRQSERYNIERKTMKDAAKRDSQYEVECDIKRLEDENKRLSIELERERIAARAEIDRYRKLIDAHKEQRTKTSWWKRIFG